jgi:WD40 repeat protein
MPSPLRRAPALLFALAVGVVAANAGAQPDPKKDDAPAKKKDEPKAEPKAAEPTAADVAALAEKFRTERAEALKARFPAEAVTRADDLAKRAEAALKENNTRAAAKHYRDARWQLPYLPVNLPPHVVRVFGESRMRHPERVNGAAYSPDGTTLASASTDGTVKVWNLGNGRELVTYRGHAEQGDDTTKDTNVLRVGGVAFHPKEKVVASVGGSQIHLWNPDTGKQIKVLATIEKSDRPLKAVAFRPDGKAVAVGGDDGILRVYEVDTGKEAFKGAPRNARIERVAFSPNGKLIGVADTAGNAAVYAPGVGNGMPMSTQVINVECLGVGFTADGTGLFTCGRDAMAHLIAGPNPDGTSAGNTASELRKFVGHAGAVTDLAATPDGKYLVTGGEDRTVRVWEVSSGKQVRSFQGHMTKVLAVAVRGDGRQIASASEDGAIRLWDLSTADDHRALTDATEPVWAVAVSPDGKRLAAAGADKTVRVYNPETGALEVALPKHKAAVTSLAFFPDSNRLVAAGGDRLVSVWDVAGKKVVKELAGHDLPVLAVALSPDGKLLVSGAADRTARGWDPEGGKQLWSWGGKSAVTGVAVRTGGKQVAVGTADGSLVVLDVAAAGTPKELSGQSAHVAGVAAVAYSPDGSKLASVGGDGALRIWTVADTGQPVPLAKFDGQAKPGSSSGFSPLSAVTFSADGRFVASAGADAVVRVWDVQTKAEVRGLRGHTEWATAVAFSPDARLLVSAGADKTVRVFELAPQEGSAAAGHLLATNAVAVSPDGKTVATASVDQTIKLWDLATGKELATLIGNADTPFAVAFLGNETVVMGGSLPTRDTGRLHFWQTKPPRLVASLPTGEVYTVVGLADGSKAAAWSARPVVGDRPLKNSSYEVLDKDGKVLATVPDTGRDVKAATFSADLTWAAAGDDSGTVRIWDLEKKERIGGDLPVFPGPVGDLGLTPDKKYLVTISPSGLLKVVDLKSRDMTEGPVAHKAGIRGLLVSPKGDMVLTLGADREVKAWSLTDPKAVKEVRTWKLPVGVNGAAYTPDGKGVVTANADGTAYVLELP